MGKMLKRRGLKVFSVKIICIQIKYYILFIFLKGAFRK